MDHSWYLQSVFRTSVVSFTEEMREMDSKPLRIDDGRPYDIEDVTNNIVMPSRRRHPLIAMALKGGDRIVFLMLVESHHSNGTFKEECDVHIVTDPRRFRIEPEAVVSEFGFWFPGSTPIQGGYNTGLLMYLNGDLTTLHYGAPLLPCNVWLDEELAGDGDDVDLFEGWLARYRRDRGYAPVDEDRSFKAAVTASRRRLQRGLRDDSPHY